LHSRATNRDFRGVAEGNDRSNTIFRAFAEAYERHILLSASVGKRSSNGFAAHLDIHSACLNACLEMIERDALLKSWFRKKSPIKILKPSFLKKHLRAARRYGFNVNFYQIDTEWMTDNALPLPIVLCIIRPVGKRGYFSRLLYPNHFEGRLVGFGCSFSLSTAIWKSFREASLPAWYHYRELPDFAPIEMIDRRKNVDHFKYYLNPSHVEAFDFIECEKLDSDIITGDTVKCSSNVLGNLTCLRENARRYNYSIAFKIFHRAEGSDNPFWVAIADIPQLQDLWFGHTYKFIKEERLGRKEEIRRLQPWPHPIA